MGWLCFFNSNRSRKPAYKPKQAEGIYLVEYLTEFTDPGDPTSPLVADAPVDLNVDLGDGPYLPPDQRVVSVDTDESGLFSIAMGSPEDTARCGYPPLMK